MGITSNLAEELYKINELSENDIEQIKLLIIDYFAAAFAGYSENKKVNCAVEKVVFDEDKVDCCYVFMQQQKYSAQTAAFMNAFYVHGAELDDGNKKAAGHVGVHVISSVFALADKIGATQNDVLKAIACGYEAYIRISSAAQPGLVERGFHSTGVVGTIASAVACAKLLGLDAIGIENAIALATTTTGGILSYGDTRPAIKPINPGNAARNGLFAALLANEKVEGPLESLEGSNGWFHSYTNSYNEQLLKSSDKLLIHECYIKQYPSCRHTHCGIDAAIALHRKVNLDDIKNVNVYIYHNAIKLAGQIRYPKNKDETKFSIHYTLACALKNGHYGVSDMKVSEGIDDSINNLIACINLNEDNEMENRDAGIRGARVEVVLKSGEVIDETVFVPKGDPENPMSEKEIIEKLKVCAYDQINEKELIDLIDIVKNMGGNGVFINPMKVLLR